KAGDLTANLRTDGSRRARHENRLAAKLLRNAIVFQVHRGPGQQVLDCNVAGNTGAGKPFQDFFHSVRIGCGGMAVSTKYRRQKLLRKLPLSHPQFRLSLLPKNPMHARNLTPGSELTA